jgi:uncharacterized protein YcbK (DUF882 family)
VPDSIEYADPSNSGIPLVRVKRESLDDKLTDHFQLGEFARIHNPDYNKGTGIETIQKGGNIYNAYIRLDPALVDLLEKVRQEYGGPITISSGYRTKTYNDKTDGADLSMHRSGMAADIKGNDLKKLMAIVQKHFADGGIGDYPSFIHADRGKKRRW